MQRRGGQEIVSLELAPTVRNKLLSAGFGTVGDLQGTGPIDLAREANLTHQEALFVLKVAFSYSQQDEGISGAKSAQQIYQEESEARPIITFCPELDEALGGGVFSRQILEICGVPGAGKTQLGMQLAVDVQIPPGCGGLGGEAVYIDTEGSFMPERLMDMSVACVEHVRRLAQHSGPEDAAEATSFMTEAILNGIHYFRVHDSSEQLAVTQILPEFLDAHPKVRLVVIDSITFCFRQGIQDMAQRTRLLAQTAQQLMQLAHSRDVAVVLTNQVTTKVNSEGTDGKAKLVPALVT